MRWWVAVKYNGATQSHDETWAGTRLTSRLWFPRVYPGLGAHALSVAAAKRPFAMQQGVEPYRPEHAVKESRDHKGKTGESQENEGKMSMGQHAKSTNTILPLHSPKPLLGAIKPRW